jgi:hypothetical protein
MDWETRNKSEWLIPFSTLITAEPVLPLQRSSILMIKSLLLSAFWVLVSLFAFDTLIQPTHASLLVGCADAPRAVQDIVEKVRAAPKYLCSKPLSPYQYPSSSASQLPRCSFCLLPSITVVSVFQIELLLRLEYAFKTGAHRDQRDPFKPFAFLTPPNSPALSDPTTLSDQEIGFSYDTTIIAPDLISQYESNLYYHGYSDDPPKLMWRSDFDTNPFRMPKRGEHLSKPARTTAFDVGNTPYNKVWWSTVVPRLRALFKAHDFRCSTLKRLNIVRFSTVDDEDGTETLSPITAWIQVRPNRANAAAIRDVTPEMVEILVEAGLCSVIEWYEGEIGRGREHRHAIRGNGARCAQ